MILAGLPKDKVNYSSLNILYLFMLSENLVGIDSDQIRKVLRRKKIWPMPSSDDGLPNWKERLHKVMLAGYTEWKHPCENKNNVKFHQGSQVVQSTNEVIIDEESDYETEEED